MKSLKSLNFEANEVLEREQMKTVLGGDGMTYMDLNGNGSSGGECTVLCSDGTRHPTNDCKRTTADSACPGGASSCAGPASICS
jgi:natural product precursor